MSLAVTVIHLDMTTDQQHVSTTSQVHHHARNECDRGEDSVTEPDTVKTHDRFGQLVKRV